MSLHLVLHDGDRQVDSWDVDPCWDATDVAEFTIEVGTGVYDYIREEDDVDEDTADLSLLSHSDEREGQMAEKLTDEALCQAILRWIEVTQQLDEIGHQLGRIKEQYGELKYPAEIASLAELEPLNRRKRELAAHEHDLRGRSCRLGNEQARLDDLIRATLPINVWYRVNGHRLRWVSDSTPRLVYEEVQELEMAA